MSFKKEFKSTCGGLTWVGKIFLLPLFCILYGLSVLDKKANGWITGIGKFCTKILFKQ